MRSRSMSSPSSPRRFAALVLLLACKSTTTVAPPSAPLPAPPRPPEATVALRPAEAARAEQIVLFSVSSPPRLVRALDDLSKGLGLPMALGQLALESARRGEPNGLGAVMTPELLGTLDEAIPMRAAITQAPGQAVRGCARVAFRAAEGARKALEAIGKEQKREGGISVRKTEDGETWFLATLGHDLLVARNAEDLIGACALAQDAPKSPGGEHFTLSLSLEALARAQGTTAAAFAADLEAKIVAELEKPAATGVALAPNLRRAMPLFLRAFLQPLVETRAVHFGLGLDTRAGLVVRATAEPTPDTPFAARAAKPEPYRLDPTLPTSGRTDGLVAWTGLASLWAQLRGPFVALGRNGQTAAAAFDQLLSLVGPNVSCVFELQQFPFVSLCSVPLKPGADGKKAVEAFVKGLVVGSSLEADLMGTKLVLPKVTRKGGVVEVAKKISAATPEQAKFMKIMMGGDTQRFAITAKGDRLVYTSGAKPQDLMARFDHPTDPLPPVFQAALARTATYDLLSTMDLMAFLRLILKLVSTPETQSAQAMFAAVPGVATLRLPLVFGMRADGDVTWDLQVPFEAMRDVAAVVTPFMGAMGK